MLSSKHIQASRRKKRQEPMITQAIPFTSISPLLPNRTVLVENYTLSTNETEYKSLHHLTETVAIPLLRSSISEPFWGSPCLATRSPPLLALSSHISCRHPRLRFTFRDHSISRFTTYQFSSIRISIEENSQDVAHGEARHLWRSVR
jgi:hypothetical protein